MQGLEFHAAASLLLTLGALLLFARQRLPIEYTCVTVLFVLTLGFELFPYVSDGERLGAERFLVNFGNEALITILLLLILAKGIEVTGALRPLARAIAGLWLRSRSIGLLVTLLAAAALSAFANNTPIVVMLLPILIGVAHRIGRPPSGILMPVGFATIVGGMCTTIGTSTNLLVVSISADLGMPRLEMFDFALPGVIAASVAILFLWTIAPRLLPERQPPLTDAAPRLFDSVIEVAESSPLVDKTLGEIRSRIKGDLRIQRIQRNRGLELVRLPSLKLRAGDRLSVRGSADAIKEAQLLCSGEFADDDLLRIPDHILVEAVVTRDSPLYRKRLSVARAWSLRDLVPVGHYRPGDSLTKALDESDDPVLLSGDVLLLQGDRDTIRQLQRDHRFLVLDRSVHVPRSAKAPLAFAVMLAVILVAATGLMPLVASALCGVAVILLTRCISLREAGSSLDPTLILVIVTSLSLGTALTVTGAADFIAQQFVAAVKDLPPPLVLSGVLLLTALLTEIVTNNAVAVIATPIAMAAADELGVSQVAFVLAVLFGANMSYITPIGYQTNLLVFSTGGYRFSDFFRVGIPLQILLWVSLSVTLPILYL